MPTQEQRSANPYQYRQEDYTTSTPEGDTAAVSYVPRYWTDLLGLQELVRTGNASPWERQLYQMQVAAANAVPMRDPSTLQYEAGEQTEHTLSGGSPDLARIMLSLHDKMRRGTATAQERALFETTHRSLADQTYRSTVPQASDANPFGMGDNLMGALMMIGMGATGGMAAAPLMAGGLTLGSVAGLLGTAGGVTGMLSEPLDSNAMRMAGLAMGAAGGATSLASLLSNGLNSVGDVVKAVQKVYGTGTKAMNLINAAKAAGENPAVLAQAQQRQRQGRTVGTNSQQLSAADQRTGGRTSSAEGGNVAEPTNTASVLGTLLSGLVGMAGTGMSIYQIEQYTQQLKDKYGQQEETKKLIDEAYKLALARYETYYARNEKEYEQKQTAYQDQLAKYQDTYAERQHQWYQEQDQFKKIEGQTDEDRRIQQENHWANRQMVNEDYNRRVAEAQQERDFQLSEHGADRKLVLESYNKRVQEAAHDRQKQETTYDQQFARHMQRDDERAQQAVEERGLDLNAYQQRQAIGKNLSDPAAIAAGAQALYNPLSATARDRINVQSEEEMARRGVAGGGMYSNLLAAKAFAPQEAQLWQNAMQNYLTGQQGALTAYNQQDMTQTPEYRWAQRPEFTSSPEYRQMSLPNLARSPGYTPLSAPQFTRSERGSVPRAPEYNAQYPGVPDATPASDAPGIPGSKNYYPEPYGGEGPGGAGPGGRAGAISGMAPLLQNLAQLMPQILKFFSGGGGNGGGDYDYSYDYNPGMENQPYDDWSIQPGDYPYTSPYDYSYDYNPGMENLPYDNWS
jgi:hypothetical protein